MRLRYLFIITFCLVAIVPMILFWVWPYSKALESELDDVKERHLVIAKNLAGAFERYYEDVTGLFPILNIYIEDKKHIPEIKQLFSNYGFQSLMIVSNNGSVKVCLLNPEMCPKNIPSDILKLAMSTLEKGKTKISTVTEDKTVGSGPILLVVKEEGENIILAYLSTSYIVNMGKKVAFGKKGHAAVVDQEGNVLAHPLDSWILNRKNIYKVSAVQKMLSGGTGVDIFYSPALKSDMIAGYTSVSNANWGVMVPQPLNELKVKAKNIDETAMYVMLLGLVLALLITIPMSFILIRPLESLLETIKLIEKDGSQTKFQLKISKLLPLEIKELKNSFMNMMYKIEDNEKAISQLAYIDVNTGLPNRNCFYKMSTRILDEMEKAKQKGALVFIDFDGFKMVNDTYGHRTGDELLKLFAQRIMDHFKLWNKLEKSFLFDVDALLDVIPARLGGDEFVILFKDIKDEEEVKNEIERLFDDVFSSYKLYGDIELKLTGSAGVAIYPKDGKKYNEILKSADIAMYKAKDAGKNTIRFFES